MTASSMYARPGHLRWTIAAVQEAGEQSEADSEVLSSASEGELASISAEVDSWRSVRNSMKQSAR